MSFSIETIGSILIRIYTLGLLVRRDLEATTALGRTPQVRDGTEVVRFLASDGAGWITGQIIEASGGWKL